jgi:hypothetical protein
MVLEKMDLDRNAASNDDEAIIVAGILTSENEDYGNQDFDDNDVEEETEIEMQE